MYTKEIKKIIHCYTKIPTFPPTSKPNKGGEQPIQSKLQDIVKTNRRHKERERYSLPKDWKN